MTPTGFSQLGTERSATGGDAGIVSAMEEAEGQSQFKVIASERFLCADPSGKEVELTVEIGEPYRIDEQEAACPVAIRGWHRLPDVHGNGTLQALSLAISLAHKLLSDCEDKGYAILEPETREPAALDATFGRSHEPPR